jgi:hypothetical protein
MAYPSKIWAGESAGWVNFITEGTWTPALKFGGATTGITYSIQTGNWTRVGDLYLLKCDIALTSKGSATGVATITGVPVAPATGQSGAVNLLYYYNLTGMSARSMVARIDAGAALITIAWNSADSGPVDVTDAAFVNDTRLIFTSVYRAA